MKNLTFEQFLNVDIRVGTVVKAESFPEARKPALKVWVDFGEIGILKTSAQLTGVYRPEELPGRQVLGVVNFPPKQVANFISEFLILCTMEKGLVTALLHPDRPVPNGQRIG